MGGTSVTTSIIIDAPPHAVWARLCDAEMPAAAPCELRLGRLGPPRPIRCELPEGRGGVGASRRCVSDRGVVTQRITAWREEEHLAFEVVAEEAGLRRHVTKMADRFDLTPAPGGGTRLTRRTDFVPAGPCPRLRGLALSCALRRVHRFVMRGFRTAAEAAQPAA